MDTISNAGAISKKVSIFRGEQKLQGESGERFIEDYIEEIVIMESINSVSIEVTLVVNDYAGLSQIMTGTELIKIEIGSQNSDRTYFVRSIGYFDKMRDGLGAEQYVLRCYSDEYIRNEGRTVFGHTAVIFNQQTEASQIVRTLMKNKNYLNSTKLVFAEESVNYHSAVIPNWRPFDVINFIAQRSYRKSKNTRMEKLQSGFQFFENALGYNFVSIDKMIEDIKESKLGTGTNIKTGDVALYEYALAPKGIENNVEGIGNDMFKLEGMAFNEDGHLFRRMRDGLITGYSIGFDPISLQSSQIGLSSDFPTDAFRYHITDMWNNMEHLDGNRGRNPANVIDSGIKEYVDTPRRIRYNILPNRIFDTRNNVNTLNYSEVSMLDTYDYVRRSALKNIIATCRMPGNLDLYAGKGIKIRIPSVKKNKESPTRDNDPRYSGRYLIASVTHKISGERMSTILELRRDSIPT